MCFRKIKFLSIYKPRKKHEFSWNSCFPARKIPCVSSNPKCIASHLFTFTVSLFSENQLQTFRCHFCKAILLDSWLDEWGIIRKFCPLLVITQIREMIYLKRKKNTVQEKILAELKILKAANLPDCYSYWWTDFSQTKKSLLFFKISFLKP